MKKLIICSLILFSCGKSGEKATSSNTPDVSGKYELYLSLTPQETDSNGWLTADTCDGLLWNSLWATAGGNVDIYEAQLTPGEWERNANGTCTSISRDMIIGLMAYLWHVKDLNAVENLITYGEAHSFKMSAQSESDGAEILTPDLIATMYELRYRLGGPSSVAQAFAQSFWIGGQTGYLANLQVMHIFLRGLMIKSVTTNELSLLQEHASANPNNAFFNAVYHKFSDGDQSTAANSLMNNTWFPADTLPTNANYCTDPFLFQRDEYSSGTLSGDWSPCSNEIVHPGIDLELAAAIILDKVN